MAKGKKTGGRNFPKGNKYGGRKKDNRPPEQKYLEKKLSKLTAEDYREFVNILRNQDVRYIEEISKDKGSNILRGCIARVLFRIWQEGNQKGQSSHQ